MSPTAKIPGAACNVSSHTILFHWNEIKIKNHKKFKNLKSFKFFKPAITKRFQTRHKFGRWHYTSANNTHIGVQFIAVIQHNCLSCLNFLNFEKSLFEIRNVFYRNSAVSIVYNLFHNTFHMKNNSFWFM